MSKVSIGKKVSDTPVAATGEQDIKFSDYRDKNIVVYFYPRDSTPGCTTEGQGFRDNIAKFRRAKTVILGVSRDSVKSHENFKAKQEFPFDLLSDKNEELCAQFDVIKEKMLYGKKHMGIERSTFLINKKGVLKHEWRKVKVAGHVDEVLETVKALNKKQG